MNRLTKFLLCAILCFSLPASVLAQDMPKIFVPQPHWDFGKTPKGGIISHKYWTKNVGSRVLYIIKVRPGCGCTQAPLEKLFIPPNDSAPAELVFNSTSFSGKSKKGAIIVSTDSITGQVSIDFTVDVVAHFDSTYPLYFQPCSLTFVPTSKAQQIDIKNVSPGKVGLKIIDSPDEYFQVSLTKGRLPAGKSCKLKIQNKKGLPMESSFKSITLEATGDSSYRFTLPIRWIGWDEKKK